MKQFRKEQVGRGREHREGGRTSRAGVKQIFFTSLVEIIYAKVSKY